MAAAWYSGAAPVMRRVRAYFAVVNRAAQTPVLFDPAEQGNFNLDMPPAPWMSLGWIQGFTRTTASKSAAVMTGIPASPLGQVRESLDAQVSFQFLSWTKLTMALATGSQHMNVLAPAAGAVPAADGGPAATPITIQSGSTAGPFNSLLQMPRSLSPDPSSPWTTIISGRRALSVPRYRALLCVSR